MRKLKNDEITDDLNRMKSQHIKQLSKLEMNRHIIRSNKKELENKNLEIDYLKNNNLTKKITESPFLHLSDI